MFVKKIRVLLAEDDETNAKAARGMLEQLGCSVDVVMDGTEAVEHFRERLYDLVLMDAQMPLMNGFEATICIRALPGGDATPIIGTTSGNSHEDCLKAGMNEVVPKPFMRDKLKHVLSRWTHWGQAPKACCSEA